MLIKEWHANHKYETQVSTQGTSARSSQATHTTNHRGDEGDSEGTRSGG